MSGILFFIFASCHPLKANFSKSHFQRGEKKISYTKLMIISQKFQVDFGTINAEKVQFTMIQKTYFAHNVTCSLFLLFCGSASHIQRGKKNKTKQNLSFVGIVKCYSVVAAVNDLEPYS